MADFDKAQTLMQTNEWELLEDTAAGSPYWESAELLLPDEIGAVIHIDLCHRDANAVAAGSEPEIIVLIKSGAAGQGTDDDKWHELIRYEGTGGTALTNALDAESAAGQKAVNLTNTSSFQVQGKKYFLDDNDAIANDEIIICQNVTNAGAGGEVFAFDNLSNTFASGDDIFSIVDQWNVRIPKEVQVTKVLAVPHDADATFAIRVRASKAADIV